MSLTLIHGPMFSSKTTELYRNASRCKAAGLNVLSITHALDTRSFGTHAGEDHYENTIKLPQLRDIFSLPQYQTCEVIIVDEAQFFNDLKDTVIHMVDMDHKQLVVAGLDGDFQRNKFGQILDLIPVADKCMKLSAICKDCLQEQRIQDRNGMLHNLPPATFTKRIIAQNADNIVIGGSESYKAVCRKHYHE